MCTSETMILIEVTIYFFRVTNFPHQADLLRIKVAMKQKGQTVKGSIGSRQGIHRNYIVSFSYMSWV